MKKTFTANETDLLEKDHNKQSEQAFTAAATPYGTATISSGGTTKVASLYLRAGQTLTISITRNTSSTLLFFYLMNSAGDIVGPKTLGTDENLFVKPTGSTQMAPLKTDTWGVYINNDGDVSTSITYSLSY